MVRALAAVVLVVASPPRPAQPIPPDPARLARVLTTTTIALRHDVDRWRAGGSATRAPADVELWALYQQRIYGLLARDDRLGNSVVSRLPRGLRAEARDAI